MQLKLLSINTKTQFNIFRHLFSSPNVGVDDDALKASLLKFASKLSEARRILRLFDDLPMLSYTLHYGFGDKEKV